MTGVWTTPTAHVFKGRLGRKMKVYQVRFEYPDKRTRRLKFGVRNIKARSTSEAIARVRELMPLSSGHWVNALATESA